jgi:hypothetical protein
LIDLADVEVLAVVRREDGDARRLLESRDKDLRLPKLSIRKREAVDDALTRRSDHEIAGVIEVHEAWITKSSADDRHGVAGRLPQRLSRDTEASGIAHRDLNQIGIRRLRIVDHEGRSLLGRDGRVIGDERCCTGNEQSDD